MENKSKEEIVKEMQQVVNQMVIDDIEENPEMANEYFECDCCGKTKSYAGSIQYGDYRLCNDWLKPVLHLKNLKIFRI